MATEWVTVTGAKQALGLQPADTRDDLWLVKCVDAVNRYVDDTRPAPPVVEETLNPRTAWGALQLVTRWYSRRNSGDDSSAAFVEFGGAPPAIDRDIELALQTGRYAGPVVA